MNTFDLKAMLDTAAQIFSTLSPVFYTIMVVGLITSISKAIHDAVQETSALQVGRLNPLEKPKNHPPADPDAMPEPPEKPKNGPPSLSNAIGLGDDGELIYADEQPAEEEPRYMRRLW